MIGLETRVHVEVSVSSVSGGGKLCCCSRCAPALSCGSEAKQQIKERVQSKSTQMYCLNTQYATFWSRKNTLFHWVDVQTRQICNCIKGDVVFHIREDGRSEQNPSRTRTQINSHDPALLIILLCFDRLCDVWLDVVINMSLYDSLYQEQSVFITFRTISELVNTESAVVSVCTSSLSSQSHFILCLCVTNEGKTVFKTNLLQPD